MANEAIQGHECGAYVALGRFAVTEHGMAYGARTLRLRSPHSSRGCYAPPGRTGKPSTGLRGTGDSIRSHREVREMRSAKTVLSIMRDCLCVLAQESLASDVIRKRSCVVLRGAVGKVPLEVTRWPPTLLSCTVLKPSRDGDIPA